MEVVTALSDLRTRVGSARTSGDEVGLVPTMGYLHAGHVSLVRRARARCGFVVVSVFVNPLQFGAGEDLDAYPRDPEGDIAKLEAAGCDLLFQPSTEEMYPEGEPLTRVHVGLIGDDLCGRSRPVHFDGVALVVTKLLAACDPDAAFFGRKDAQQLALVRRLAADLSFRAEIVGCPTVRESDGLAMSSRNAYLSPEERRIAPRLFAALSTGAELVVAGEREPRVVVGKTLSVLAQEPRLDVEYVEVRDARTVQPLERLDGEVLLAVAARLGPARLIDNVVLHIDGTSVTVDAGEIN
ncbi:MAG: pantoate--beta-alanine ligase [Actinobacteria bacterium ATB1]|nr:pantoate--beta-alanine ligase [Actinobacteria bacterium ATB1]